MTDNIQGAKPVRLPPTSTPTTTTTTTTTSAQLAGPSKAVPRQLNTKNLGLRLASDAAAAASAAIMVAPLITVIDQAIMENASGRNPLKTSLQNSLRNLVMHPQTLLVSKPFALICMLYGGTYLAANTIDTLASTTHNQPAMLVTAGTPKFAASSAVNVGGSLFKDQAFAKLFGPGGPPRPVPPASYLLFTIRDCLTIFASFNVPPRLGPLLSEKMGPELSRAVSGYTVAQFVAPATIQMLSTPLHLLGLDMYNRIDKDIRWKDRWNIVKKNWAVSTVARVCRIVPAYGIGGVVNRKVRLGLMQRLT